MIYPFKGEVCSFYWVLNFILLCAFPSDFSNCFPHVKENEINDNFYISSCTRLSLSTYFTFVYVFTLLNSLNKLLAQSSTIVYVITGWALSDMLSDHCLMTFVLFSRFSWMCVTRRILVLEWWFGNRNDHFATSVCSMPLSPFIGLVKRMCPQKLIKSISRIDLGGCSWMLVW